MKKIRSKPLYEQVADQVERMILRGEYKKGEFLPSEAELIEMTGVSRITVREALRTLAELGMIETYQGKGSMVVVDYRDILQLGSTQTQFEAMRRKFEESTQIRIMLEPEVARHVALHATKEDIHQIETYLKQGEDSGTNDQITGGQDNFHLSIMRACRNETLIEILEQLQQQETVYDRTILIPPNRQATLSAVFQEHHEKIFTAIKQRDGEFSYFYMKEHLLTLEASYKKFFDRLETKEDE